jgi:hypothetical protein
MRRVLSGVAACVLASAVAGGALRSGEKKRPAEAEAIEKVVRTYLDNLGRRDKVAHSSKLFLKPDVAVVGIDTKGDPDKFWVMKAPAHQSEMKKILDNVRRDFPYKTEGVKVELITRALATARVSFSNELVKYRGVFTFTSVTGQWKIASFVYEAQNPGKK